MKTVPTNVPCRVVLAMCLMAVAPGAYAQVRQAALEERDGLWYEKERATPYTGPVADPGELEGRVENGKRVGEWVWWYPSGQRMFVVVYEDGQRIRSARWHANSQQESAWTYKDGRPDGVARRWDEHGELREEQTFEAGEAHGPYKVWDPTGALLYSAEYRNGQPHGPAVWWYADGRKRWETRYADGTRTGRWSQWERDGSLRMQSTWEDGHLVNRYNPHAHH